MVIGTDPTGGFMQPDVLPLGFAELMPVTALLPSWEWGPGTAELLCLHSFCLSLSNKTQSEQGDPALPAHPLGAGLRTPERCMSLGSCAITQSAAPVPGQSLRVPRESLALC